MLFLLCAGLTLTFGIMDLINLAHAPDSGSIYLNRQDITKLSEPARIRAGLSRTLQISSLFYDFSILENVLVEHELDAVFALADDLSVLVGGVVIASGPANDVRENIDVIDAYLGPSE